MKATYNGQLTDLSKMINTFFNEGFSAVNQDSFRATSPACNFIEYDHAYELELIAPGLEKSDFNIGIEKQILTVETNKVKEKPEGEKSLNRSFDYGKFKKSFELPKAIALEQISAQYQEGILIIELPKKPEEQKIIKQIKIK